jgi:hypothetical protein
MKPYGREKKLRFSVKLDVHPKKGYENWWESICRFVSRREMKQKIKNEIDSDLDE